MCSHSPSSAQTSAMRVELVDGAGVGGAELATMANTPSVPASASVPRSAVAGHPAPLVGRDEHDVDVHHVGRGMDRGVGLAGGDEPPSPAGRRRPRSRARWRAVTSADRLAADPPLTKHPPAPSGNPASVGQPGERLVLGGDGPGAALPQAAEDARRADDEVEQVGRRRRRRGHVGQVHRVVHRPAGVHQHVAEQRQRGVAADALRRMAPSRATASSSAGRAPQVGSLGVFSRSTA